MEDLTKHQLILLTLLITFITSIGTSIISFSLLQEAPIEVTQTINRVVERTIETVVEPGETKTEKVIETVVVSEEDRVVEAIGKNEKAIVRLKTPGADGSEVVSGFGLVIDENGTMVADIRSYTSTSAYSLVFADGTVFPIGKVYIDNLNKLVFIKPDTSKSQKYDFVPATLGDSSALKIGQSVVAISGRETNSVSIGRIKQLTLSSDKKTISNIISDIPSGRSLPGSPILSLSGEIMGIEAPVEGDTFSYIPSEHLKTARAVALVELEK
ncbi:MAG TPA: serine protease [Candidatus Paceibacterota bacterium]